MSLVFTEDELKALEETTKKFSETGVSANLAGLLNTQYIQAQQDSIKVTLAFPPENLTYLSANSSPATRKPRI